LLPIAGAPAALRLQRARSYRSLSPPAERSAANPPAAIAVVDR